MSTVAQLIDRTYRTWLYPAQERPITVPLTTTITAAQTTFVYDAGYLATEEEDLIDAGVVCEIDRELMLTASVNTGTRTVTVGKRGYMGTTAAIHTATADIVIAPLYPRQQVFDALADTIEGLWPDLYVKTTQTATSSTAPLEVPATVEDVIRFIYPETDSSTTRWLRGTIELLRDFPGSGGLPTPTNVAVQFLNIPSGQNGYLTYKARFTRPTLEADDLASTFGIPTRWDELVIAGAVMRIMGGRNMDLATAEYLSDLLEQQGFNAGTGERLFQSLSRLYGWLLDRARRDQAIYDEVGVLMNDVVVTG